MDQVILHYGTKIFLPMSVRAGIATVKSVKYIWEGLCTLAKGKIEVPVLDGTAIGVSVFRGDHTTASSVMFLLSIGEILEEWTHKKSVGDLARSMSLNISKVWVLRDGREELEEVTSVQTGDRVVIHMGNVIPFDGDVVAGEAMVNQASLTGESNPVRKAEGGYAYAGTVVEEGEITIRVKEANGSSKYEKIMTMIEESEKLKSSLEGKAAHLADRLVPYTFAGTGLVWLLTRNTTKALSVLMVDFSCALKLAMPLTVLSAIREASTYDITVKGGKYLEAMVPEDKKQLFEELPEQYSHLYMAIDGLLAAVICIEDPLRKEAPEVIRRLKQYGISKVVMMTGDSDRIASTIADKVGVDEYYSEVLPEDKAKFVEKEKNAGRKVVMIGDGINDSPALSEASVGIAISDGAEIAREIADVTISADDLYEIATLKQLSDAMVRRINKNYRLIVGINTGLIVLGIAGIFQPTMSALFHNTSTILISLKSMNNLLDQEEANGTEQKR